MLLFLLCTWRPGFSLPLLPHPAAAAWFQSPSAPHPRCRPATDAMYLLTQRTGGAAKQTYNAYCPNSALRSHP